MEKAYFIFKMTGAAMVRLDSSVFSKAPSMRFPEVRAGFFEEFCGKKTHQSYAYYSGIDQSGWIVLIKSEILIITGMVWLACSDKWKALLDSLESSRC